VAADLKTLIAQVWSPEVRPLADEAWCCYNAGAIRASIAATWSAVSADTVDAAALAFVPSTDAVSLVVSMVQA